jgi:2,4-dienoyl-CoA reductase-like NADH-dependent reductase (Old Yellow Enzyme family)
VRAQYLPLVIHFILLPFLPQDPNPGDAPAIDNALGNVMVSEKYMGSPSDIANMSLKSPQVQKTWKDWASACQSHGTPAVVQLCHPGRQSPPGAGQRSFFEKSIAPSAVAMSFGPSLVEKIVASLLFGTPKEMSVDEIEETVDQFVRAAKQCFDAGFKGVELHAA